MVQKLLKLCSDLGGGSFGFRGVIRINLGCHLDLGGSFRFMGHSDLQGHSNLEGSFRFRGVIFI